MTTAAFDSCIAFDAPPWVLSGDVFVPLLNHVDALEALGDAVHRPPYAAPPKAPVLAIKPRNTLAHDRSEVVTDGDEFEVGASLGLVLGRSACRVAEADALDHVAGCTLVIDLSVPHHLWYRPQVRSKARDGSCLIGPRVVPYAGDRSIRVSVDGVEVGRFDFSRLVRPAARPIADVSAFMTLSPGDLLTLGVAPGAPRVRAGQRFAAEADRIGRLSGRAA